MSKGFEAVGTVVLDRAKVGLDLDFGGATLRYAKSHGDPFPDRLHATLFAYLIQVGGNVWLNHRFVSYGAVDLGGARIGSNLHFDSGHFINPNNVAIAVPGASVDGVVYLASWGRDGDVKVTASRISRSTASPTTSSSTTRNFWAHPATTMALSEQACRSRAHLPGAM